MPARPGSPLYDKAIKQINHEIGEGNYRIVPGPPNINSPHWVIEKPGGEVRSINNCSEVKT